MNDDRERNLPLVTVAIPTRDRLSSLIASISSVKMQNYPRIQLVILNNGSSDGTRAFLSQLPSDEAEVVHHYPGIALQRNWNACLSHARGEFLIVLSDDDAFASRSTVTQLVEAFINEGDTSELGLVFCDVLETYKHKTRHKTFQRLHFDAYELLRSFWHSGHTVVPSATMLRTEDVIRVGGYTSGDVENAVDALVWMKCLLLRGRAIRIPDPLVIYQVHEGATHASLDVASRDLWSLRSLLTENIAAEALTTRQIKKLLQVSETHIHLLAFWADLRKSRSERNEGLRVRMQVIARNVTALCQPASARFIASRLMRGGFRASAQRLWKQDVQYRSRANSAPTRLS